MQSNKFEYCCLQRRSQANVKTLVVGCDASGKSSMLEGIQEQWGDHCVESTRSEEASAFRKANHTRVIDADYIAQRESLYLGLSHQGLLQIKSVEGDYVTSDSCLVTRLSHSVMRQVISEPFLSNDQIIDAWQEDEARAGAESPNLFVLTYADFSVIRQRMEERRVYDHLEYYWGFNAPLFLEAYQGRWREMMSDLSSAAFNCLSLNTSENPKDECVAQYSTIRQGLAVVSER